MPDYELHTDYDRDGRLSAVASEHNQRQTPPGAILLPNLDVDARQLPGSVSSASAVQLDWQHRTKSTGDNDLLALQIRIVRHSAPANSRFFLKVIGWNAGRVQLYDRTGHAIVAQPGFLNQFPLTFTGTTLDLKLEGRTLVGSPLTQPSGLSTSAPTPTTRNEAQLQLDLLCIDPAGQVHHFDAGIVTLSPWLLIPETATAQRMYICELPDNEPSVREVRAALAVIGSVSLTTVPVDVSSGDCWLQDQFQFGYCQGPGGWMNVITHLPRLRANVVQSSLSPNLSSFVDSYFPSQNLGVFQDFWQREIRFNDASGAVQRISFTLTQALLAEMDRVAVVWRFLMQLMGLLESSSQVPTLPRSWATARRALSTSFKQQVLRAIANQSQQAESDERRSILTNTRRDVERRIQMIERRFPLQGGNIQVSVPSSGSAAVSPTEIDRLYERLRQMHGSANYGGNVEVAPPTPDAPWGKIVIGNTTLANNSSFMDPDVLLFLQRQRFQPLVEIDTTWLDVAHVDELMSFVPNRRGTGFAILRAGPLLAWQLINAARNLHWSGLPEAHPYHYFYRPSGIFSRRTDEGQHPVSMLLRGKLWLHHHPQDALQALEPPFIYRKMADVNSRWVASAHEIPYWRGEGQDRLYPAGISIHEVLHFEQDKHGNSVNTFIEQQFMSETLEVLRQAFQNVPVYPLPVLFDAIDDLNHWADGKRDESTSAFTSNIVNMQIINNYLLIPRPYGPRLRQNDAIQVLREVMQANGLEALAARLNPRYFVQKGLTTTHCWIRREDPVYITTSGIGTVRSITNGIDNIQDVAEFFRDGFPGQPIEQVCQRIQRSNRSEFQATGRLRPGWRHLRIPENTIDLFEAYTQLVADALGLQIHWVDSWFYHVRFGEIHCGTNVLRQPNLRQLPRWWVPQPSVVTFDADEDDVIRVP